MKSGFKIMDSDMAKGAFPDRRQAQTERVFSAPMLDLDGA